MGKIFVIADRLYKYIYVANRRNYNIISNINNTSENYIFRQVVQHIHINGNMDSIILK